MTHDDLLEKIELTLGTYISKHYGSKKDVELRSDVIDSLQSLRAVVELHKPVLWQKIEMVCDGCGMNIEQNYNSEYPCATIEAIEKELA